MIGTLNLLLLAALGFSLATQAVAQDDVDECAVSPGPWFIFGLC